MYVSTASNLIMTLRSLYEGTPSSRTIVSLQCLVHGEVAWGGESLQLGVLCLLGLQLEHLEQSILPATRDPAFGRVPAQCGQLDLVGNGNLYIKSMVGYQRRAVLLRICSPSYSNRPACSLLADRQNSIYRHAE